MVGLDSSVIASLSKDQSIGRVRTDIQTDFIFAPQYKLLFDYAADDLWDQVVNQLRSGTYTPSMLITAEVPKPSGLTRPGSVLYPIDRIIYQAMADYLAPIIDPLLDGARVYSYRILGCDPELQMFQSRGESYEQFKATVTALCNSGEATHAITTDIASYFGEPPRSFRSLEGSSQFVSKDNIGSLERSILLWDSSRYVPFGSSWQFLLERP